MVRSDQDGCMLQGLHQVGAKGIFQQNRHGAGGLEILGGDGLPGIVEADHDPFQPLPQVAQRGSQR